MVDAYVIAKWAHILFAIVAVGFNASYGVLIGRAEREPQHLAHVLRTVKIMDDRVANPCYGLLLVTGLVMAYLTDWALFSQFWLRAGLGLYVVAIVLGAAVYTPTLKRQIRALDVGAPGEAYRKLAMRGTIVGITLIVIVLAIVWLMVTKPAGF